MLCLCAYAARRLLSALLCSSLECRRREDAFRNINLSARLLFSRTMRRSRVDIACGIKEWTTATSTAGSSRASFRAPYRTSAAADAAVSSRSRRLLPFAQKSFGCDKMLVCGARRLQVNRARRVRTKQTDAIVLVTSLQVHRMRTHTVWATLYFPRQRKLRRTKLSLKIRISGARCAEGTRRVKLVKARGAQQ